MKLLLCLLARSDDTYSNLRTTGTCETSDFTSSRDTSLTVYVCTHSSTAFGALVHHEAIEFALDGVVAGAMTRSIALNASAAHSRVGILGAIDRHRYHTIVLQARRIRGNKLAVRHELHINNLSDIAVENKWNSKMNLFLHRRFAALSLNISPRGVAG